MKLLLNTALFASMLPALAVAQLTPPGTCKVGVYGKVTETTYLYVFDQYDTSCSIPASSLAATSSKKYKELATIELSQLY